MIGRTQGHLAATVCLLAFGACSNPNVNTDLRPDGPPEVLTVLASDDAAGDGILEGATFCKLNDDKRPGLIPANPDGPAQVCPDNLAMGATEVDDTVPLGWYVRIQFDELLNPNVEDLLPIPDSTLMQGSLAKTQPVTVSCVGANVPYDGYYDPSGNSFTWPTGPSLFIQPVDSAFAAIPTGSECSVTIKADVVADKDGNHVPTDQLGPYKFKIAPLGFVAATPAKPKDPTKPATIDPANPLNLSFNANVDPASLAAAGVVVTEVTACTDTTGTVRTAAISQDPMDTTSLQISDANPPDAMSAWDHSKIIQVKFTGAATVKQALSGAGTPGQVALPTTLTLCFKTDV